MNEKINQELTGAEVDVLFQLFLHGPTFDGDISSKVGRGGLFEKGLATRTNGYSYLTPNGVERALAEGFERKKEKSQTEISKALHEYRQGRMQDGYFGEQCKGFYDCYKVKGGRQVARIRAKFYFLGRILLMLGFGKAGAQ